MRDFPGCKQTAAPSSVAQYLRCVWPRQTDADRKFGNPAEHFGALDADPAQRLALAAGDIALVLDDTGHILDVSVDEREFPDLVEWAGANWLETVTIESRPKVMEMLAAARKGEAGRWRQVNRHLDRDYHLLAVVSQFDLRVYQRINAEL